MPRVALVTASSLPLPAADAPLLADALAAEGLEVEQPVWDDADAVWPSYDAVVIGSTWDYHHRLDEFLGWVDKVNSATLLFNIPKFINWNCRKNYINNLAVAGINVIPSLKITPSSHYSLTRLMPYLGADKLVMKPLVGASAEGIEVFQAGDAEAFEALKKKGDHLAQPFVNAITSEGEISITMVDGEICHAVRKSAAAGDFRVQEEHGGTVEVVEPTEAQIELAAIVNWVLFDKPLYARVDMVEYKDRPALMELELIEPDLHLRHAPETAGKLAKALAARIAA